MKSQRQVVTDLLNAESEVGRARKQQDLYHRTPKRNWWQWDELKVELKTREITENLRKR